jgi:hypothetical protein
MRIMLDKVEMGHVLLRFFVFFSAYPDFNIALNSSINAP